MKALTETVISLFDLAEAEGRLFKQKVLKTLAVSLLMMIAAFLALGSLLLLMAAFYNFLVQYWEVPIVFLVTAVLGFGLAGGVIWYALQLNRKV